MTIAMNGGEVSPLLWARVDLARYGSWLKTCVNWIVQPYGGVKTRPGTQYIATTKNTGDRVRLIPFTYNSEQNYVIELGDHYARFHRNGAPLMALKTATDESIGTGDGVTTDFQLLVNGSRIYTPNTVIVSVGGVVQQAEDDVNLCRYPEAITGPAWITCSTGTVSITTDNWTPPGALTATGDTLVWSET